MKKLGLRLENIDTLKTKTIKPTKELAEYFKQQAGKPPYEYIKDYLNDNKLYNAISEKYIKFVNKTLPKDIKASCQWCNGDSEDENDKNCNNYHSEAQMNFFFASYEFVSVVERNKYLINGKELKKRLTLQFYECFAFSNGRVIFDLEKMSMYCLNAGFLTLSKIFSSNSALQNLSIINDTIDELNTEELNAEMFNKEKSIYLEPQKKFFENKQKHFKNKHFIDSESEKLNDNTECKPKTTDANNLLLKLKEYRFSDLESLTGIDLQILATNMFNNQLPYQIAYLDYLGFIKYLNDNFCKSQKELHKLLSKILDSNERAVRGNINGLRNDKSNDRKRYTAYQHTKSVEKHYQTLK